MRYILIKLDGIKYLNYATKQYKNRLEKFVEN